MLMSLNILKKYVDDEVRDVVSIGFSDLDHLILESFKGKVVSFMVPPQFVPYLSERKCEFVVERALLAVGVGDARPVRRAADHLRR